MAARAGLPTRPISDAKDHLAQVVDDAVHKHLPQLIARRGEGEVMVIGLDEQRDLLRSFVFAPRVVFGDDVVITLDRHGLVASGSSLNAAADAMLNELREYSQEFLTRYEFFRHTTRNQELPWLLRFALTPEETQRELLFEETQADQVQSVEGSAVAQ